MESQNGPTFKTKLNGLSWNVQSIRNKCNGVMEHILDDDADIVFVCETWMQSDSDEITAIIRDYGYKLIHNRRIK